MGAFDSETCQAAMTAGLGGETPIVLVRDLGVPSAAYGEALAVATSGAGHYELDILSQSKNSEVSVSGWADALEQLLDDIPAVSAVCIGDGVGALVLEHFAATRPNRVARLVLISSLHGLSPDGRREYSDLAESISGRGVTEFIKWRHARSIATPELSISDMTASVADLDADLLAHACRAVASAHTSDMSSVVAPTLVCADTTNPEQVSGSATVRDAVPESVGVEIAGNGANLAVTNPTELGERVRDFLAPTKGPFVAEEAAEVTS